MAIDPQQCGQGPGLDFLLPTDPNTAIGRRRFLGEKVALQVGPVWAQPQTPVVLKLLISVQVELHEVGALIRGVCAAFQDLRSFPNWLGPGWDFRGLISPPPASMQPDLAIAHVDHMVKKGHLGLRRSWLQSFGFHGKGLVWDRGCHMHVQLALWHLGQKLGRVGLLSKLCNHMLRLDILPNRIGLVQVWAGFPHASQRAKESSLDQLLQLLSPNGWVPRWWRQELLVSPPGLLTLTVLGLRRVQVQYAPVESLPCALIGPWSLQKLPFQHLLELDHIQMPQCLCPLRVLH